MSISYIPRVTQLDAVQLDTQVEELLKQQLLNATQFLEPGILQPFMPELELIIRTWMFKYSVTKKKHTFGQQMLSLQYKADNFSVSKLWWYYGYTVGLRYLKERAIYSFTSNTRVQSFVHKLETFQLIGDILNFLRFVQSGRYPVLIDFILGLELSAEKLTREDLSDLAWTRELLWHNFIELIGTVVSLVNLFGMRRKVSNILKYMWWRSPSRTGAVSSPPTMTVLTVCAFCSNKPVLPYTMGCSHIFCYYCLMGAYHELLSQDLNSTALLRTRQAYMTRNTLSHSKQASFVQVMLEELMANKTADQDFPCPKCYYNGKDITKYVVV